jgi:periplasmic protein CpxP/Spy
MTPAKIDIVATQLKRLAEELNLSDSQQEQLRTRLAEKHARLQEFMQQNPDISLQEMTQTIASVRGSIREQIVNFLTPQQLEKWDTEMAKAREFLGHRIAA